MGPMTIHVQNATFTKQLLAAFLNFAFACTVQFICTVHANSAIHLHCSVFFFFLSVCIVFVYFEQCNLRMFFFFIVCIVFVYFFYKKTSFTLSCKQYFLSWKTSIERIKFTRTVYQINFIHDNILSNFIARSKNYRNCSSCRMNFVRNVILDDLKA